MDSWCNVSAMSHTIHFMDVKPAHTPDLGLTNVGHVQPLVDFTVHQLEGCFVETIFI